MNTPKQFYLDKESLNLAIERSDLGESKNVLVCIYPHKDDLPFLTKFIEYSAYEKLQKENTILKSGAAIKLDNSKITAAGKLELVMNLLNPVNENDEPQEPLITPEQARELLGFKDE